MIDVRFRVKAGSEEGHAEPAEACPPASRVIELRARQLRAAMSGPDSPARAWALKHWFSVPGEKRAERAKRVGVTWGQLIQLQQCAKGHRSGYTGFARLDALLEGPIDELRAYAQAELERALSESPHDPKGTAMLLGMSYARYCTFRKKWLPDDPRARYLGGKGREAWYPGCHCVLCSYGRKIAEMWGNKASRAEVVRQMQRAAKRAARRTCQPAPMWHACTDLED